MAVASCLSELYFAEAGPLPGRVRGIPLSDTELFVGRLWDTVEEIKGDRDELSSSFNAAVVDTKGFD